MTIDNLLSIYSTLPVETKTFVWCVLALAIIFQVFYNDRTVTYGPTILTTTGIFATFLGIALGLANFDSGNIQASVPALLSGLKTAFWASVVGIGGALLLKLRYFVFGVRASNVSSNTDGEVTGQDLAKLLRNIQQALVGEEEATLVSQIKLSRADTNERLDALRKAQGEALQKLSEMGSKQLVEALRDVIRDFNQKISEQFGENFKHLNDAVGKLLVWQEQYKEHIEQTTLRQGEIVSSMHKASDAYRELVEKADSFTQVSQSLSKLLSALEVQKEQLVAILKSLSDLLTTASGSLPQIEKKVVDLTDQMTSAVAYNQAELNKALTDNGLLMKSSAQEISKQLATTLADNSREVTKALTENVAAIRSSVQSVGQDFAKVNQEFNKHVSELAAKTKEQVSALDVALAEELRKSLESLGRQLTALSERFVEDYSPLTERLREVVKMAGQRS